jgi:hypothetical protein
VYRDKILRYCCFDQCYLGVALKPHCIQSSRVLVPAGTSKSTSRHHGIQAVTRVMHALVAYVADAVTLWCCLQQCVHGGFELGSSALTSSNLKWLHRIQCGFKLIKTPYSLPRPSENLSLIDSDFQWKDIIVETHSHIWMGKWRYQINQSDCELKMQPQTFFMVAVAMMLINSKIVAHGFGFSRRLLRNSNHLNAHVQSPKKFAKQHPWWPGPGCSKEILSLTWH